MHYRTYDPQRDKDSVHRIWQETGWLEKGKEEIMDTMVEAGHAFVADVDGQAECLVITAPGTIRYLDEELPFCAVTGVTTSRIVRRQGFAKRLAAQAIANDAAEGALVAGLGMFEQGYYNQIGFGSGGYEHWVSFDPATLNVKHKPRIPRRLTLEQIDIIHAARLARKRGHGGCNLLPSKLTKADMMWTDNGFGLGYFDGPHGELTHFIWGGAKEVEHGPYRLEFMAYQTGEQFLELMALLKSMGDQVRLVRLHEPRDIIFQDLIVQPFKHRQVTEKSTFEMGIRAAAYWQMRICDLHGCLEHTHLRGDTVRFNLTLEDPIATVLDPKTSWRGVGGEYIVTLGPRSWAETGKDASLPTLKASVGAFTRLWLGVRPASGLAVTDDLSGPPDVLARLDWVLRLPEPKPEWDF